MNELMDGWMDGWVGGFWASKHPIADLEGNRSLNIHVSSVSVYYLLCRGFLSRQVNNCS